ncbi:hypothetical protein OIU79_013077, partial [Salix purpurea]
MSTGKDTQLVLCVFCGGQVTELAEASRGATTGRFIDSQDGWGGDEGGKECHENKDCEALVIEN